MPEPNDIAKPKGRGLGWRKGQTGNINKDGKSGAGQKLDTIDRTIILKMSRDGKSVTEIANAIGRASSTISRFLARNVDTRELAMDIIKSGAAKLAERIVNKANVDQAINVLSRPGIDVIQPEARNAPSKGFGLQISVAANSCGTVVSVQGGENVQGLQSGDVQSPRQIGSGQSEGAREGVPATQG